MRVEEQLASLGWSAGRAAVLTLGTEGFKPPSRVLMLCVLPLEDNAAPWKIYIQGGGPELSAQYTRINPVEYRQLSLPWPTVRERLLAMLGPRNILVGHNILEFSVPFLRELDVDFSPGRGKFQYLDTMTSARLLLQVPRPRTSQAKTLQEWNELAQRSLYNMRQGWALKALAECGEFPAELSEPEANAYRTRALLTKLLALEC